MKTETAVEQQVELYRLYLLDALTQRDTLCTGDQTLDLHIISLIDKLEALLWVLDQAEDELISSGTPLH